MLALYTAILLKSFIILVCSIHFFGGFFGIFYTERHIVWRRCSCIFELSISVHSCFISAPGFSNVVLHSNSESSHPWLVLDLREKTLNFSSLSMMLLAVFIFWKCPLRKCFSPPGFLRVFIRNGCWILLSVPIWMIIGLFSLQWLIFTCQTRVTSLG